VIGTRSLECYPIQSNVGGRSFGGGTRIGYERSSLLSILPRFVPTISQHPRSGLKPRLRVSIITCTSYEQNPHVPMVQDFRVWGVGLGAPSLSNVNIKYFENLVLAPQKQDPMPQPPWNVSEERNNVYLPSKRKKGRP
jgi:hypothetical protein